MTSGCAFSQRRAFNPSYDDDLHSAKQMIRNGQRRQAIDELTMLIEMNPKDTAARFLRGVAYQGLEEYSLAIADYEKVLKTNSRHEKAHYNLGMIYAFKLNDPKGALNHFDQFLSLEPNHPESYPVAKIMCSLDQPSSQSEGNPEQDSPLPSYLLAKDLDQAGKDEEAIRSYRKAIEIRPTCIPCRTSLGELLIRKKKNKEGEIQLMKAKLFGPGKEMN